jgi:hypothetical protein
MKRITSLFLGSIITALCFLGYRADAQIDTIFNGYISPIVATSSTPPNFSFQGAFINQSKTFTADQAPQNSFLLMATQGMCYEFQVDTIYAVGNILYGEITDLSGNLASLPSGQAAIFKKTNEKQLLPYPAGVNVILESCIQNKNMLILDTASAPSASILFDSDRPILRTPSIGTNIGGSTVNDWLSWWYFTAPSLTLNLSPSTTVYEVGDSVTVNMSGNTSNPGMATLSSGELRVISPLTVLDAFGTGTAYSSSIDFVPTQDSTSQYKEFIYSFRAFQGWVSGSESGTAQSPLRTIQAVYPVLYGMSSIDLSSTGDPYVELAKLVETEGNKTVTLTGSGFIYYAVPKTWSDFDLSQIIDHNGFNVTPSFTAYDINVSSTGQVNDWSNVQYKLYKLNTTTTTSGYAYQFIR